MYRRSSAKCSLVVSSGKHWRSSVRTTINASHVSNTLFGMHPYPNGVINCLSRYLLIREYSRLAGFDRAPFVSPLTKPGQMEYMPSPSLSLSHSSQYLIFLYFNIFNFMLSEISSQVHDSNSREEYLRELLNIKLNIIDFMYITDKIARVLHYIHH